MSDRRLVVEAAFGFGPFDTLTAADWVPLVRTDNAQTRAMQASWEYGRDNDLDPYPKGTASVTLWNHDRFLDPDYSGSPYAGELLPRVPVRLRSQDLATLAFRDEFYGFVEGGWEQILAPIGEAACRVQLVDMLGVMEGFELPDPFEHVVLSYGPKGFWVLDTADAEQVADLSGNGNDGIVNGNVRLGDRVIVPGHRPAARFDNVINANTGERTVGFIDLGSSPIMADVTVGMVMATFQARSAEPIVFRDIFIQINGNTAATAFLLGVDAVPTEPFGLVYARLLSGIQFTPTTTASIVDGKAHLAFGWANNLKVDGGATITDSTSSVGGALGNGIGIGGLTSSAPQSYFDGWIGAVALWADHTTVGDAGRAAILDAYSKLNGQRSDQQIAWALDRVGVPAGLRNLDVGTVPMGPAASKGRPALEWIRDIAATEGGEFYVDHRNGGKVRFRHRYARYLDASGNTSQATFSDAPDAGGVIRYTAEGLDLAPNGLDSIVNQMTVQWAGGEITISDATSITSFGPRPRTLQTVATTAGQARSTAEWTVSRRKDPASRIRGCVGSARSCQFADDAAQGLELGDQVTFRVHPTGVLPSPVGTATMVALHVEAVRHEFNGVVWQTSFRFSSAPTFTPWIWGTSAWGTTAFWG